MREKRDSRYVRIARLAYEIAQGALPTYSHRNSRKTYTQPQLAACVLLMFYLNLSYRDMEELLLGATEIRQGLGLSSSIPDHTTLNRMYHRLRVQQLEAMNHHLLKRLGLKAELVAVDATSYSRSQASLHFATLSGMCHHFSHYWKGYYVVDIPSQAICAWRAIRAPSSDMAYLAGLRRKLLRIRHHLGLSTPVVLLADRGFDGRAVRPGDLIPPRRPILRSDRLERQALVDSARLDAIWRQSSD